MMFSYGSFNSFFHKDSLKIRVAALLLVSGVGLAACSSNSTIEALRLSDNTLADVLAEHAFMTPAAVRAAALNTAMTVGAIALIIPGLHFIILFAEAAYLWSLVTHLPYEIGASILSTAGCPQLLEPADLDNVLYAVTDLSTLRQLAALLKSSGNAYYHLWNGSYVTAPQFYPELLHIADLASGQSWGIVSFQNIGMVGAKTLGATLGGKFVLKHVAAALHFVIPFVGPAVIGAAINWFLISKLAKAAILYFDTKALSCVGG